MVCGWPGGSRRGADPRRRWRAKRGGYVQGGPRAPVVCIDETESIFEAAGIMKASGTRHLAVGNENQVLGMFPGSTGMWIEYGLLGYQTVDTVHMVLAVEMVRKDR